MTGSTEDYGLAALWAFNWKEGLKILFLKEY